MDKSNATTPSQPRRRRNHFSPFLSSGISNTDKGKLRTLFHKTHIKPSFDVTDEYDLNELSRDLVYGMYKLDKRWTAMDEAAMENSCPKFE